MRKPVPKHVEEPAGLDKLKEFTRRLLAVSKEEIDAAEAKRRAAKLRRRTPKSA
jgi:hypothetical protein